MVPAARQMFSIWGGSMPNSRSSGVRFSACMPLPEYFVFSEAVKTLLPSRGIALMVVLPEPFSAPIPAISTCISPMVSEFVM